MIPWTSRLARAVRNRGSMSPSMTKVAIISAVAAVVGAGGAAIVGLNRPTPAAPRPAGAREKVAARFDADGNGWLDRAERDRARAYLETLAEESPRGAGPGGPLPRPPLGGGRPPPPPGAHADRAAPSPGPRVAPADVAPGGDAPLYATGTIRTLFLELESPDWEAELAAFHGTDVEVPATLTVDGKAYPGVGVRYRGNSSYFMTGAAASAR
jgi:hypothetical protein